MRKVLRLMLVVSLVIAGLSACAAEPAADAEEVPVVEASPTDHLQRLSDPTGETLQSADARERDRLLQQVAWMLTTMNGRDDAAYLAELQGDLPAWREQARADAADIDAGISRLRMELQREDLTFRLAIEPMLEALIRQRETLDAMSAYLRRQPLTVAPSDALELRDADEAAE